MKYLLLVYLLASTASCSTAPAHAGPGPSVDPELLPYIYMFENEGGVDASFISAKFESISSVPDSPYKTLAYCYYATGTISVDPTEWAAMTIVTREILMFHELGHCVLGILVHRDEVDAEGCATSMMHFNLSATSKCYLGRRTYYLNELFGRSQ